ncbi:hypothetical protein D3C81_2194890 [compost metagenome]
MLIFYIIAIKYFVFFFDSKRCAEQRSGPFEFFKMLFADLHLWRRIANIRTQ